MVLQTITSRTVRQGCAMADLHQDLQPVVGGALAAPNVQTLDPLVAATGQPEGLAFIEAMGESKFVVTAYARPSEPLIAIDTAEDGTGQAQNTPGEPGEETGSGRVAPRRSR
ncbi:hypothetical protein [Streptomyces inhibens]|nr:hypothetical protein [Streptomyces inhibens]